jgi:hypothetical protein
MRDTLPSWFGDYIREDDVVFGYDGDRKRLRYATWLWGW